MAVASTSSTPASSVVSSSGPLQSPLKQQARPSILRSKSEALIVQVLDGSVLVEEDEPQAKEAALDRFMQTLFVLSVHNALVERLAKEITEEDLARDKQLRENIAALFTRAAATLADEKTDEAKRDHIVDLLTPILRELLSKHYTNFALEVMTLLSGSLDRSDVAFTNFVVGLDVTLGDVALSVDLRHRALKLALIFAAAINSRSLNSYFLRRGGLFGTLVHLIGDPATESMVFDASLLLSILASVQRFETLNPFQQRLQDLVDDGVMTTIIHALARVLSRSRQAYIDVDDDAQPTFTARLSSILAAVLHFVGPKKPPPATPKSGKTEPPENPFASLPPLETVALLPLYDLLHSNDAFGSLLLADVAQSAAATAAGRPAPSPLLSIYVSFCSYLFCHAASSARSRLLSRLCLITLTILVESGPSLAGPESAVERQPMLPFVNDQRRPLMCAILDCLVIYIRHNIRTALDLDTQIVALQLVHRCAFSLKSSRTRLGASFGLSSSDVLVYDWSHLWRAVLTLATFVAARKEQYSSNPKSCALVDAIIILLDFACVWSPVYVSTPDDSTVLFFEILRAESAISELGTWSSTSTITRPSTPQPGSARDVKMTAPFDESLSNLRTVIKHFNEPIKARKATLPESSVLEADEVLAIIRNHEETLDLGDSPALEDVRPFAEGEHETFLRELVRSACGDILSLQASKGTPTWASKRAPPKR